GRGPTFDLPDWMREVPAERVRDLDLDLVIYQTPKNLEIDGPDILSDHQRAAPLIYLEHNTPKPDAVLTRHPACDPRMLLVHVTHYNRLMWDNGDVPTAVVEHSVAVDPAAAWSGALARGITVVNGIERRPRIAGLDLFLAARRRLPLDIAGMGSERFGGLGDIPYRDLHRRIAPYRFLYSPMRYTSLPLAVIEAMTIGMPVVALATTELPTVIDNGVTGFVSNDPDELFAAMARLLADRTMARRIGEAGRRVARERFGLDRFARDWNRAFERAIDLAAESAMAPAAAAANGRVALEEASR
ncbi:MAG TPA: glycosyltransferase, partial [Thermomicrobiales bacterium]|nr:glycosyltransferase [Thermomicrobiales bacterium]